MKIIKKLERRIEQNEQSLSFEYFPPKTDSGVANLYRRVERMAELEPTFVDITWGAGGSRNDKTLEIAENLNKFFGLDVLMHLTCAGMPVAELDEVLDRARDAGIRNILALRGDPPTARSRSEQVDDGFSYAHELVTHIRKRFGDQFCVGVAGYPEGHVEAKDADTSATHLKHKVDCGADFVITQLFYDLNEYAAFLERCRRFEISCPVIPGVLPIQSYDRFLRIVQLTGVKIPESIWKRLRPIKQDDARVREYGVELSTEMCRGLVELGVPGFHFYTLNIQSSTTRILERLGRVSPGSRERALPWRSSSEPTREREEVRPIFWSNRPKSYVARTVDWDDYPNGRWGDRHSPAFGELHDCYLLRRDIGLGHDAETCRAAYGTPVREEDIFDVFASFCAGEIDVFPWVDGSLQAETGRISTELVALNRAGYLSINSQPQVSGAPSDDPEVGWGGPGGVVYQKAYLELFLSEDKLDAFLSLVDAFASMTYQAVNREGELRSNLPHDSVTAVTWGVFPGREIVQPTVVDSESFLAWKDEAFDIWNEEWGALYPESSASRRLIETMRDSYWLLNLVENDFTDGDIFGIFRKLGVL